MGNWCIELCGGTYLSNSGQVGFCKIVADGGSGGQRSLETGRRAEGRRGLLSVEAELCDPVFRTTEDEGGLSRAVDDAAVEAFWEGEYH